MKERFIIQQLLRDRFSPRYKGFNFLLNAILTASDSDATIVVTRLYDEVACQYSTSWQNVERCIRNAIEMAWDCKKEDKPTNGDYIAYVSTLLRISGKQRALM